jgi:hypothetical protein
MQKKSWHCAISHNQSLPFPQIVRKSCNCQKNPAPNPAMLRDNIGGTTLFPHENEPFARGIIVALPSSK